ncbi:hypothetical protein GR183_05875 [Stappia sp. GBMRC 2046]|uniref:Uncharacterized protein n=1 Tax=Stappia sediminis TaxID=2692190 RepID=A0A7X3S760_9HYPH|nr:hypothetical protein [Stappia sediminis]MXN64425.1 hypothetical protein [Stappia sediminis]
MGRLIDQESNYAGDFGAAFRSSAIFYKPNGVKTTISFSNYWYFKNSLEVGLVVSYRRMNGELVTRKEYRFTAGNVINIEVSEIDEGSVEIEAFSSKNLKIPYAAIMCVYETENGVSMVHSYGRNHSLIELEDDRAITEARESCWTLRASPGIRNQAIFHNGHVALEAQTGLFVITSSDGTEEKIEFNIPSLAPFETLVFEAENIFPKLQDFLSGNIGWGTLHFESYSSFTRLLIVWLDENSDEIQVTHSNFDYSSHQTNMISSSKPAYMALPSVYGELPSVIVYPKFSKGIYVVNGDTEFTNGTVLSGSKSEITFTREDGLLPARIVTAASAKLSEDVSLPFECSLGIIHEKRPPKRFHWFLVSSVLPTVIHLTAYDKIYPSEGKLSLVVRLYSQSNKEVSEVVLNYDSLVNLPGEIKLEDIFNLDNLEGFGYASVFSHYGGLIIYSSLRKNDVVTVEHSF